MGIFDDIGTFIVKTIPKVITKDIPRLVTKDIPNVVTKEIPRIVTKDIPRIVTKDIPNVVTKDIPRLVTKDLPKAVTKDLPNLVTKGIPNLITKGVPQAFNDVSTYLSEDIVYITDPETYQPGIGALRARVEKLESGIPRARGVFLELRARYYQSRSAYMSLVEDYENKLGKSAADTQIKHVKDVDWDDPNNTGDKALAALDSSFRFVAGFITFGISEAAWVAPESKKEEAFLEQRQAELAAILHRFNRLSGELNKAIRQFGEETARLRKELGANSEDVPEALNDERMAAAHDQASLNIATNMLKNGEPVALVEMITGLDMKKLKSLTKALATERRVPDKPGTVEAAQELVRDGMKDEHIIKLTGITPQKLADLHGSLKTKKG